MFETTTELKSDAYIKRNFGNCVSPDGEENFKKVWKAGVVGNKNRDSKTWEID